MATLTKFPGIARRVISTSARAARVTVPLHASASIPSSAPGPSRPLFEAPPAADVAADAASTSAVGAPSLCRSIMFVPGSNMKALAKMKGSDAQAAHGAKASADMPDAIILDLEDAVSPASKEAARANVIAAIEEGGFGPKRVIVRVNGIGTAWYEGDVAAVAKIASKISAVLLPKAENASQILALSEAVPPQLALWATVETPKGILQAADIASASASANLTALVAGTSDLVKDLRARHTRDRAPILTSLSMLVLAARAWGISVFDGVHLDLHDMEGLRSICLQARDMGFDGKCAIHPSQNLTINDVFSPSPEEVAHAKKLIHAHEEAVAAGSGVTVVDGKLVEHLHVDEAKRVIALASVLSAQSSAV